MHLTFPTPKTTGSFCSLTFCKAFPRIQHFHFRLFDKSSSRRDIYSLKSLSKRAGAYVRHRLLSSMSTSSQSNKWHSRCLTQRVLVFDTAFGSCTIMKDKKVKANSEDYWAFKVGPRTRRADTWDLYLNREEDMVIAVAPNQSPGDAIYLANLRLGNLGFRGRLLRKAGALSSGYVLRP
ncbi:hypothetical protein F4860DRAFT_217403 [Xylaria cubensis]|nr:hypothetical protein F4860DRAFT_217403 [Xylaria cubensis]